MTDLITRDLVRLDASLGADKQEVIQALDRVFADAGRSADPDQLAADALTREGTAPTGLPGGIAIPHCRTTGVDVLASFRKTSYDQRCCRPNSTRERNRNAFPHSSCLRSSE